MAVCGGCATEESKTRERGWRRLWCSPGLQAAAEVAAGGGGGWFGGGEVVV